MINRMHKARYDSRPRRSVETRLTPAPLPIANSLRLRFTLGTPSTLRGAFFTYFFCTKFRAKTLYINKIIYTFRTFVFYNIF